MSNYTPTTEEVRDNYARWAAFYGYVKSDVERQLEAFDRWLAAHDAEIRADEREKAAQRVMSLLPWGFGSTRGMVTVEMAAQAARGGEQA